MMVITALAHARPGLWSQLAVFHLYGYPGRFPLQYFFFHLYLQINELRLWETLSLSFAQSPSEQQGWTSTQALFQGCRRWSARGTHHRPCLYFGDWHSLLAGRRLSLGLLMSPSAE